jgi:nucleotide-binding universal stress UspA family protein
MKPERHPGGYMISTILVPTDGSKTAQKAAKYAVDLCKQLGASMLVVSVIDKRSLISQAVPASATKTHITESTEDYLKQAAEQYTGEITALCDRAGIKSDVLITTGHPVEEIVKRAEKMKADIIVIGSHGRSALTAAVLGSVTYGVIHKDTRIPVLIVRR